MKKLLLCFILLTGFVANGQVYNNEWIDHDKRYYKFKSNVTGLHRISMATLNAAGLGGVPAEQFQLWRNGEQVALYTSVASGTLGAADYIEFWGEMNDGKPDRDLYKNPDFQLNDKWSLSTDQATYFLTANPATAQNKRLVNTANNIAGNTLPAEPYFIHTAGTYYRNRLNAGWALDVGQFLYSSSYHPGEGWSSLPIDSVNLLTTTHNNLFVYPSGPDATITYHASGNSVHFRRIGLRINDTVIDTTLQVNLFNHVKETYPVPISLISSNTAKVQFDNIATAISDRMVVAKFELKYPRVFNFGGASSFVFNLPASASGVYLEISGFSYGAAPVLLDLTNGKRYPTDIGTPSTVKVVLEPSATDRKLVLVSDNAPISQVASMEAKTFRNFSNSANQGDYMIITSDRLYPGTGANAIEDYKAYRSSPAGGSYKVHIYLVDELTDQFGFGINKHPVALRNFLLFARARFNPKFVFFIGKGVDYTQQFFHQGNPDMEKLNLVPTFGYPASDALLVADRGSSIPRLPFGRLSVINNSEISIYLEKVKETERAQANVTPFRVDREWMKNVVHLNGIGGEALREHIDRYYRTYKQIISDTLFGGRVTTFEKTTNDAVQQISSHSLDALFKEGISIMTYFGHSAANTLEFNLDNPEAYDNKGKYPFFIALGCNAGNFFNFGTVRLIADETISEKYVLAENRGTIGFIASTHFGIPYYLDKWNTVFYEQIAKDNYGATIGEMLVETAKEVLNPNNINDFPATANVEETAYHGDPALRVNPHAKPDYVIDEPLVKVAPSFISIADTSFQVKVKMVNIGRAVNRNLAVSVKRQFPNGEIREIIRQSIPGIRYADSLTFNVHIDPVKDKGANKLSITVDADNAVEELFETNNTITKDIFIFEDEIRPVYPYNLSIVSRSDIRLVGSVANAFSVSRQYAMEIDTTELFNSPLKVTRTISSVGGVLEFEPGLSLTNNTVYYWRLATVPPNGAYKWNTASFIYIQGSEPGFNQSHLYQHFKSSFNRMAIDSSATWKYGITIHNLFGKNGMFPTSGTQDGDFSLAVDGTTEMIRSACVGRSLVFNVFDYYTFKPWKNVDENRKSLFLYGSGSASCARGREYNFEFSYMTAESRKKIMDFMDIIPEGSFVAVRSFDYNNPGSYSATWRGDTTLHGSGNSLYHKLKEAGFVLIDSIDKPRSWILIYQKGKKDMEARYTFSEGIYDKINLSADCPVPNQDGTVASPVFGPAKAWKTFEWIGTTVDAAAGDKAIVNILGYRTENGNADTLYRNIDMTTRITDISSINASVYPFVQLKMSNLDSVHHTAYQLGFWRLKYDPVPEGALAPNIYVNLKDTVDAGQPLDIKIAFKNVTPVAFDSLKVKLVVTDVNNVPHVLPIGKFRPLPANDTLHVHYLLDTRNFVGQNSLFIDVNPDNDQPEQFHFNNFAYRNLFVRGDSLHPLLDVTFDNVHILNNDIVSPKPEILIKLRDESSYGMLDTSSLVTVKLRKLPNGTLRSYTFDNDTLRFTPAQKNSGENTATVHFFPQFKEDGKYELVVGGKDKVGNETAYEYRVTFEVVNKPMISNMLNYPNPFTTSTAFVFTLTGSEVPQEFKIQILTVTGKVVREITRHELGPIRIGRNITEFKWDGTDQYGQKLANGVYLYRVVTSVNGKALDKYKAEQDKTDQYFNKGYGKMYLMR